MRVHPEAAAMARRFAVLKIAHWRAAKGFPKLRRANRLEALWWMAAAKGKM